MDDCKAIFFVKDLDGNKDYVYAYEDVVPGGGKKVSVDFLDGENILEGSRGMTKVVIG